MQCTAKHLACFIHNTLSVLLFHTHSETHTHTGCPFVRVHMLAAQLAVCRSARHGVRLTAEGRHCFPE